MCKIYKNENSAAIDTGKNSEKQPEIQSLLIRFDDMNNVEEKLISSIKEKLREILKWEQPEHPEEKKDEKVLETVIDKLNFQLQRKQRFNEMLNDCLLHLKEIV